MSNNWDVPTFYMSPISMVNSRSHHCKCMTPKMGEDQKRGPGPPNGTLCQVSGGYMEKRKVWDLHRLLIWRTLTGVHTICTDGSLNELTSYIRFFWRTISRESKIVQHSTDWLKTRVSSFLKLKYVFHWKTTITQAVWDLDHVFLIRICAGLHFLPPPKLGSITVPRIRSRCST